MTIQEAIEAMQQGHKVTHWCFYNHQWTIILNNRVFFDDRTSVTIKKFLKQRESLSWWQNDWSIFKPVKEDGE